MNDSKCLMMSDGSEIWIKNKKLHRLDGPAIVRTKDNYAAFYVEGYQYSLQEYAKYFDPTPKQLTMWLLKYNNSDHQG